MTASIFTATRGFKAAELPKIREMLSSMLFALKFRTMSEEVLNETEHDRLCKYARCIAHHTPATHKAQVRRNLYLLGLVEL